MSVPRYLVITEESHDASTVHGIYDTFEEARSETERKTAEDEGRTYKTECIYSAVIQEWERDRCTRKWERLDYRAPHNWRESVYA